MEFLEFKGKQDLLSQFSGKGSPKLRYWFKQYMKFGGFPQVALTIGEKDKTEIITLDYEEEIKTNGKKIQVKNLFNELN